MSPPGLILLDTNILVHVLRGKVAGAWLRERYALDSPTSERPLVSIITLGELLALATKWNWAAKRRAAILDLEKNFVVVDIRNREVLARYAELGVHWERQGRRMEQNDLWIAATAKAADATLLTTDGDFRKLAPDVRVEWIDPDVLKNAAL